MSIKHKLITALEAHAEGHIKKHLANIEVYLENPVGVGEHPDIIEAIEQELNEVAKYHDQLEVIEQYFDTYQV
jgi:hypothetical protein